MAGRRGLAALAAGAVLLGAVAADARLAALDAGALPAMHGRHWEGTATLLEPVREHGSHASARVRLAGLDEQAVIRLRVPAAARRRRGRRRYRRRGRGAARRAVPGSPGRRSARSWRSPAASRRSGATTPTSGAGARMRRSRSTRLRATGAWRGGLPGALDSVRRRAEAGLARGLSPPEAALLSGMVLGEDERLSEEVRTDFKRSGLAHLLAVSGQNVVLLAMLVLGAGMALGLPLRARLGAALMLVALYVPLAGGGPSIQRAGVMGAAGLVAALAGRPASRWYALGLAAAVTLAINPRASGEPGWQLSFAAVAGLLALVPRWREGLRRARLPGPVADAIAVTAAATLATAPLMALHFEQVSLASLPANLVAAPAVAPVMWLGMGSIALAQVSPALCAPLNALNGSLLAYLEWIAHVAAQPPAAALPVRIGGPAGLAVAYVGLAAALGLAGRAWRRAGAQRHRLALPAALGASVVAAVVLAASHRGARAAARGRARRLVPRHRPGRRDAAAARRRLACSSTPGRPAARSCAGSPRRAWSASTRSCSPMRSRTTRAWRSPSSARTARGSCSTAAPGGRRRSSERCPPPARAPSPRTRARS